MAGFQVSINGRFWVSPEVSRFDDTPDRLIIELTEQGYIAHGSNAAFEFE